MDAAPIALDELARRPRSAAEVGGKAANLGALRAAGVAIPDGFVIPAGAREKLADAQLLAQVRQAAAALGAPLVVRSSSPLEDRPGRAAAGVFTSRTGVALAGLDDAVRAVWDSGASPTARAYARARGDDGPVALAVIVQRQVAGTPAVVYTRPPGDPDGDHCLIEIDGSAVEVTREGRAVHEHAALAPATCAALVAAALAAESAIDAERTGADVETVLAGEQVTVVQARPIVHGRSRKPPPPILLAFSRGDRDTVWRWDVTHNPDPLSPAQAGLVERVDAAGTPNLRQRVVGGYLYYATGAEPQPPSPIEAAELQRRWDDELEPALERSLAALEVDPPPELPAALAAYVQFCQQYARTGAVLRGPRRALLAHLEAAGEADPERCAAALVHQGVATGAGLAGVLRAAAAGELSFEELVAHAGPMAPAWDVAVPTYAETPDRLRAALERAPAPPRPPAEPTAALPADTAVLVEAAGLALALGERDDRAFARAQAGIRRALLRLADRWGLAPADDVFFLPLDEVLEAQAGAAPEVDRAHRRASAERSARERRRQWAMPLAICDGRPVGGRAGAGAEVWTGRGTGGRAEGRIARAPDLADLPAVEPDTVLLVATVTPGMAVAVRGAAALVAAHGGLLGHGAALARELGIPCVVDCPDAWASLEDGERVLVDADAGLVVRRRV